MTAAANFNSQVGQIGSAVAHRMWSNVTSAMRILKRAPRPDSGRPLRWSRERIAAGAVLIVVAFVWTLVFIDAQTAKAAMTLPDWIIWPFRMITEFGKSGWFLWPLGLVLLATAAFLPNPPPPVLRVLSAIPIRAGFLFTAIAIPGAFTGITKYLIGRVRPYIESHANPYAFNLFDWHVAYASLPSGHATNAVAAAAAIGAMFPAARPVIWLYALLIASSRIVLAAHFPSDVLAGAVVGWFGALLVRDWFASRRLGFAVRSDGTVHPMPTPSWRKLKTAFQALLGTNKALLGRRASEFAE